MASNLKDIYVGVNKADANRNKNDLYRTPPLATYILCKYSNPPKKVVEPCAGFGNIAAELIRNGHNVVCYDLNEYPETLVPITTGVNALDLVKPEDYDGLITNPPYASDFPRKLAEKAVKEYAYVALLLRLTFLEGIRRKSLFEKHPPTQILFFSDRVRFNYHGIEAVERKDQIDGMIAYAWFIWAKYHEGPHSSARMRWISMSEEYNEWRKQYDETRSAD
jgi:hypothetical protein